MSSTDSSTDNLYGYTPTKTVCIIFVALYALSTTLHTWQAARSRAWFMLPTVVLAGIAEIVGWVARTKSSGDPTIRMAFIIQTSILVLAPTPFVAALFIGFGRVVGRLGPEYSRLSPRWYSRIFLTCDLLSLFIQGGGGGIAASSDNDAKKARLGSNIILGGLIIQLISMTTFCFFMGEYAWRRSIDRPFRKSSVAYAETGTTPLSQRVMSRHMKMLIAGICISTVLIYIRSAYRVVEFIDGFNGKIAHTQILFNVFDGAMVTLAMYTLNFMHPGQLLQKTAAESAYVLTDRGGMSFSRKTSPTVETYMIPKQN
ncbi:RTA1-domain-containing protein [Lenzites betulinus]|nr:RTA1-domain-containing protein [Lenzites betulinus]